MHRVHGAQSWVYLRGKERERVGEAANEQGFLLQIERPMHRRAAGMHTWLCWRLPLAELGCNSILRSSVLEFVCCSEVCPGFQNRRIWLSLLDLHQALSLFQLAFPICRVGMMLTIRFQRCGDTSPITSHLYLVKS